MGVHNKTREREREKKKGRTEKGAKRGQAVNPVKGRIIRFEKLEQRRCKRKGQQLYPWPKHSFNSKAGKELI